MTNVECPYCGKYFKYDCWEDIPHIYYDVKCEYCEKEFEVTIEPLIIYQSFTRKFGGSSNE